MTSNISNTPSYLQSSIPDQGRSSNFKSVQADYGNNIGKQDAKPEMENRSSKEFSADSQQGKNFEKAQQLPIYIDKPPQYQRKKTGQFPGSDDRIDTIPSQIEEKPFESYYELLEETYYPYVFHIKDARMFQQEEYNADADTEEKKMKNLIEGFNSQLKGSDYNFLKENIQKLNNLVKSFSGKQEFNKLICKTHETNIKRLWKIIRDKTRNADEKKLKSDGIYYAVSSLQKLVDECIDYSQTQ